MEDWKDFESTLQAAIEAQLPTGTMPYSQVNVLMICFEEDDMGSHEELTKFRKCLEDDFHWSCETWLVEKNMKKIGMSPDSHPSTLSSSPRIDVRFKIVEWAKEADRIPNSLGIVYYSGHGVQNKKEKSVWR